MSAENGGSSQDQAVLSDKCEEAVRQLSETVEGAISNRALLETSNQDKKLIAAFQESKQAFGLNAVRFSVMQTLLIQVVRCWDRRTNDRASFPSLLHWIEAPGLQGLFIKRAATWHPRLDRQDLDREAVRRRIVDLREGINTQNSEQKKERYKRLSDYRHKFIAHNLITPIDKLPFVYDVYDLLDETLAVAENAAFVVLGRNVDYASHNEIWLQRARHFWASVRAGQFLSNRRKRTSAVRYLDEP